MELNTGGWPNRPAPGLRRAVRSFGRPVGVLARPVLGPPRLAGEERVDGHPWAVEIGFGDESREVRVRTVRELPATIRIRPVHLLAEALVNFAANAEMAEMDRGERPARPGPAIFREYADRAAEGTEEDVGIEVGSAVLPARLLRVERYAALEVGFDDEVIVCLAPADIIGEVALSVIPPE